jgi:hypothetical protein
MSNDYTADNWTARRAKLSAEARAASRGRGYTPANKEAPGGTAPPLATDVRTPFFDTRTFSPREMNSAYTGGGGGVSDNLSGSHPKGDPISARKIQISACNVCGEPGCPDHM